MISKVKSFSVKTFEGKKEWSGGVIVGEYMITIWRRRKQQIVMIIIIVITVHHFKKIIYNEETRA